MTARRLIFGTACTADPVDSLGHTGEEWIEVRHRLQPLGCVSEGVVPLLIDHGGVDGPRMSDEDLQRHRVGALHITQGTVDRVRFLAEIDHTPAGDAAWSRILSGELRAVSVGASEMHAAGIETDQGPSIVVIDSWRLRELSLCASGANPAARIEMFTQCD